jgi:hypothetical protein
MKVTVALGVALAALTVAAASAQSNSRHIIVRGGGSDVEIDANDDGWITRAEASSGFERIFAELDSNDDGKLDDADRRAHRVHVDGPNVRVLEGGNGRRIRVISRDGEDVEVDDEAIEREVERAMEEAERAMDRAERDSERAERHAERAAREAERHAERAEREAERAERDAERHVHRQVFRSSDGEHNVIIIRTDGDDATWTELSDLGDIAPVPPVPPIPPVPPVPAMPFMMLIANSEEADRNGDGALSRDEFVAQHLRFFDASDANGDGRVRFDPPQPPTPPAAPAPPEPPRRR